MGHLTISPTIATMIIVIKTGILILGGLITYFSYKAHRNAGAALLRTLTLGFGVVAFGAILGGALDMILNVSPTAGLLIDSVLTLISFAVITYSLYAD